MKQFKNYEDACKQAHSLVKKLSDKAKKHPEKFCENYGDKEIKKIEYFDFYDNAIRYIKAIKQGRMICSIDTVSRSGMSRTLKFMEFQKSNIYNFHAFFIALKFNQVKNSDYFRVYGCGMDMVFHTNYTIIHRLYRLGFLGYDECEKLAQLTPKII